MTNIKIDSKSKMTNSAAIPWPHGPVSDWTASRVATDYSTSTTALDGNPAVWSW